jgi:hypothetical protein
MLHALSFSTFVNIMEVLMQLEFPHGFTRKLELIRRTRLLTFHNLRLYLRILFN